MIAVLVPLSDELLQMKHLLMLSGHTYFERSCVKDYYTIAPPFFLKTFLEAGLLKCFRSKNGKTPNIYRKREKVNTEKSQRHLLNIDPLFINLLIIIFLLKATFLFW